MAVAIGDFNADGRSDLAVANRANTVSILLGTYTGTFGAAADFGAGGLPGDVAIGDFNADGQSDLAVVNGRSDLVVANRESDDLSILLNACSDLIFADGFE